MKQSSRKLAWQHWCLSWLGGMLFAWVAGLVVWKEHGWVGNGFLGLLNALLHTFAATLLFLGLPAWVGGAVRESVMRRVFVSAASLDSLLLRTVLVFEGSVVLSWALWVLFFWVVLSPYSTHSLRELGASMQWPVVLSLPWLVSSVLVAWWQGRRLFRL